VNPSFKVVCFLSAALTLGVNAEAQYGSLTRRVRELERSVSAQGRRIATLEGQVSSLNRTVASLQGTMSSVSSRLSGMESALRYYSARVDCDAGGSLAAALSSAPATSPSVYITVSGTCHEAISIARDHVSVQGDPDATIDAPATFPWAVFVNDAQDVRLDRLTIRNASLAIHIRHGHVEGSNLQLVGGVTAIMGSTVRFYKPTVVEAAPSVGVDVNEESSLVVFGCDIRDAGYAGVRVADSTFQAVDCRIERSGQFGVLAERGANVMLDEVAVTDSGQTGVDAGVGSAIQIQYPAWRSGTPVRSRIAGSPVGLRVASGSSLRLGHVTIEGNGDGAFVGDSSVLERDMFGEVRITANTAAGVRCADPPAVPQLVLLDASSVFGNAGGDILCAGY
jgi:uncharacterized coiled-coil protein SlyX